MIKCDWKGIFALGFMAGGLLVGWLGIILDAINKETKKI
jgi:hypothetical protein